MNANDAYKLIKCRYPNREPKECFEYDTLFVFGMVSDSKTNIVLNTMFSVNKETCEVRDFKPFHIPVSEYRNGKKITKFK